MWMEEFIREPDPGSAQTWDPSLLQLVTPTSNGNEKSALAQKTPCSTTETMPVDSDSPAISKIHGTEVLRITGEESQVRKKRKAEPLHA